MGDSDGTTGAESTGEVKAPFDLDVANGDDEVLDADAETDDEAEEEEEPEPPRRRLVSELLEGQEALEEAPKADLQLVAPPLHLETIDAGQPIYQLDLSAEEPQGEIVEPDPGSAPPEPDPLVAPAVASPSAPAGAAGTIKQMVMQRDRKVMAAERDGIGAYELASEVDDFVRSIIDIARSSD